METNGHRHDANGTTTEGMSTSMQKTFGFVNVEGGVFHDVTETLLTLPYSNFLSPAS